MSNRDKKELAEMWVGWTRDAIGRYEAPDDIENSDELVDDMAEVAAKFADTMLEEFEDRFGGSGSGTGRRRRKKPDDEEEEEEEARN